MRGDITFRYINVTPIHLLILELNIGICDIHGLECWGVGNYGGEGGSVGCMYAYIRTVRNLQTP